MFGRLCLGNRCYSTDGFCSIEVFYEASWEEIFVATVAHEIVRCTASSAEDFDGR